MHHIIISLIVAFFLSFYSIPVIIHIAKKNNFYDLPDDRKNHIQPVPLLGGLGIIFGFLFSCVLNITGSIFFLDFPFFLASFLIIFFLGIADDIMPLVPFKKIIGQLVVAFILTYKCHLIISDLHGVFGIGLLNPIVSYIVSYFTILVIINAFNLIDGIDGLAGGLALITALIFGSWFLLNNDVAYSIIAFALVGSISAFLFFNFHPAKIFMGDAGSMLLGLVNAILVIHFIDKAPNAAILPFVSSPAVGFCILLIPLMDTLRVFCIRIYKGRSPFSADRNHIHHLFLDCGFSVIATTLIIVGCSVLFSSIFFFIQSFSGTAILLSQVAFFFIIILTLHLAKPVINMHVVIDEKGHIITTSKRGKLVAIFSKLKKEATSE